MVDDPTAQLTWVGHATVAVQMAGVGVLTDPALTRRVAHLRRHHRPVAGRVGRTDVVLISHLHMDHLHLPSLRSLGREVPVVVPAGAAELVRRHGFTHVTETTAGSTTTVGDLTIETVRANHSGSRGPHTRLSVDPVGYVLRGDHRSLYFAGDTDLFPEMADLVDIDVALLPIGGWGPTLGEGHLDPTRAVEAVGIIDPQIVVPIHWGTYSPVALRRGAPAWLDDPLHRFTAEMADAGVGDRLAVLRPGDRMVLPAPRAQG